MGSLARRRDLIENFFSYDNSVPFSPVLNEWIKNWYEKKKDIFVFIDEDDFTPNDIEGYFNMCKKRFYNDGVIHVYTGHSENTIFGYAKINHMFRCWHDYIHITQNFSFDEIGEKNTAIYQKNQLPINWSFERELILIEVSGQVDYFVKNNMFVEDQRLFCRLYLEDPNKALNTK